MDVVDASLSHPIWQSCKALFFSQFLPSCISLLQIRSCPEEKTHELDVFLELRSNWQDIFWSPVGSSILLDLWNTPLQSLRSHVTKVWLKNQSGIIFLKLLVQHTMTVSCLQRDLMSAVRRSVMEFLFPRTDSHAFDIICTLYRDEKKRNTFTYNNLSPSYPDDASAQNHDKDHYVDVIGYDRIRTRVGGNIITIDTTFFEKRHQKIEKQDLHYWSDNHIMADRVLNPLLLALETSYPFCKFEINKLKYIISDQNDFWSICVTIRILFLMIDPFQFSSK